MRFNTKKIVSVFLTAAMLITSSNISVLTANEPDEAETIEIIEQTQNEEEVSLLSVAEDLEWELSQDGTTLTIRGNGAIPDYASPDESPWYTEANAAEKLVIEEGITGIGNKAFENYQQVISVEIPEGVTSIGDRAFYLASGITEITLPTSVKSIGSEAFYACNSLESINLPEGLESLGSYAFGGLGSGSWCGHTPIEEITIPSTLKNIGVYAFCYCESLKKVTFTAGATVIGIDMFVGCTVLEEVIIPDSVISIGEKAFYGCTALTEVRIPKSVSEVGTGAFSDCTGLKEVTFSSDIVNFNDVFDYNRSITKVNLYDGDKTIKDGSFSYCGSITEIKIPDSITSIGKEAFDGCTGLTEIVIPDSVTSMGYDVFYECTGLTSIVLSDAVTDIKYRTFAYCTSLTEITIPYGVTSIGSYAFIECTSLKEIKIPEGVTSIGYGAFKNCTNISEIIIPYGITSIEDETFFGCTQLTEMEIPDSVTSIGNSAFEGCTGLTKITIPYSVTSIGNWVFVYCENLIIYTFPGSYAEQYATDWDFKFMYIGQHNEISVTLKNVNDEKITSGYTVNWYEKGSNKIIATGKKMSGYDETKEYEYEVILDEALGCQYYQPERQAAVITGENTELSLIIEEINNVSVSGIVTDNDQNPLSGAEVVFTYIFNDRYQRQATVFSENDGSFNVQIPNVVTDVKVSAKGYYSKSKSVITEKTDSNYISLDTFTLVKLPENKITLTASKISAVAEGENTVTTELSNLSNIELSLFNTTQNKEITEFEVQDMKIILPDAALNGGDTIEITAKDKKGEMTANKAYVHVDETKNGNAEIVFVENGKIRLRGVAGNSKNVLMLFDNAGKFLKTYDVKSFAETNVLEAGSYSLILMEKNSILRSVAALEKLSVLGFVENIDYIRMDVEVSNGVISEINDINVPDFDEEKFKYTVDASTGFTANASEIIAGQYTVVRLSYEIDSKYPSSDEKITIEFPEGVQFVEGSLTLDSKKIIHSYEANTVEISANQPKGVLRFYILPTIDGEHSLNAYLSFTNNGQELNQPIGAALLKVQSSKINVPKITGREKVTVSGKATAKADITVYDNDTPVGTTQAKANGSWSILVELNNPMKFSVHNIRAEITPKNADYTVHTSTEELVYDYYYVEPKSVTMYNTGDNGENVTVFDFENQTPPGSYRMWPGRYTKFTFVIDFGETNTENLKDVSLNVYLQSGEVRNYIADYNEAEGNYIVTADFKTFEEAPVNVGVVYTSINEDADYSLINTETLPETDKEYIQDLNTTIEEVLEYNIKEDSEDVTTIECSLGDDEELNWDMDIKDLDYSSFDISTLIEQGYTLCESDNSNEKPQYIKMQIADGNLSYILIDEEYEYAVEFSIPDFNFESEPVVSGVSLFNKVSEVSLPNENSELSLFKKSDSLETQIKVIEALKETLENLNYAKEKLSMEMDIRVAASMLAKKREETSQKLSEVVGLMSAKCPDGTRKLSSEDMAKFMGIYNNLQNVEASLYDAYEAKLDLYTQKFHNTFIIDVLMAGLGTALSKVAKAQIILKNSKNAKYAKYWIRNEKLRDTMEDYLEGVIDFTKEKMGDLDFLDCSEFKNLSREICSEYYDLQDVISSLKLDIKLSYQQCEEEEEEDDSQGGGNDNGRHHYHSTPILDPSGYVYEAVPSNRVEGVKAECYYYDYPLDEFGMPGENKEEIFWDAEEYDQINPLITDKNGMYQWDVPLGLWLVKFSKDGYYDTNSRNDIAADENGYLPVPPPQTEVNTAIVSKSAPTVENVNVYNNEVQIIFSQYMLLDSVNNENVKITCGGEVVSGTISPVNAEYDYNEEHQYASIFKFTPDEALTGSASVEISNVKNYAGTSIAGKVTKSHAVDVKPESISVAENIDVAYNSGALLEIAILPQEAGANKTLTISTASPSIVGVVNTTVTTDANGKANVMLEGKLPGEAEISISLDGTNIKATTRATVGSIRDTSNTCAKVKANIESGSEVEKGTKVTLSTETEGAEIYYTLDGTCPCVEDSPTRIKYTGPIEINEYTFIIAYAVKEGLESSSTAGFVYKVKPQPPMQKVQAPVANHAGGTVAWGMPVSLSTSTNGATIYYTLDGSIPTTSSSKYNNSIKITSETTIKAIAVKEGMLNSDVMSVTYKVETQGGGQSGSQGGTTSAGVPQSGNVLSVTPNDEPLKFTDVKETDWFYYPVKLVFERGITKGVTEESFAPEEFVTRGQFITMLCRAYGISEATGDNFADAGDTWYTGYLAAAKQLGISNGVGDNMFGPELEITREEMVTLIYNYLKSIDKTGKEVTTTSYADDNLISDWARIAVAYSSSVGYIKGKENNLFDPQGNATRAELAQIFFNVLAK